MNAGVLKFLLVDDVDDNRYLLAKTLLRKFPASTCIECRSAIPALTAAADPLTAVIVHRADDMGGLELIRRLRARGVKAPIIMVSGRADCPEAACAGATAFLNYDAWLRIGTVVEEILHPEPTPPRPATPADLRDLRYAD